jgi:hypothetical protein
MDLIGYHDGFRNIFTAPSAALCVSLYETA